MPERHRVVAGCRRRCGVEASDEFLPERESKLETDSGDIGRNDPAAPWAQERRRLRALWATGGSSLTWWSSIENTWVNRNATPEDTGQL
jgi:hypothetical protein